VGHGSRPLPLLEREKSVGQPASYVRSFLIAINSLRRETETTVVAMRAAVTLPNPEKLIHYIRRFQ
jgi:hypothetical protein